MKVFVSSLISGFGAQRQAARRAVATLRHEPVMAEDFGAQPHSPQIACLQGLRGSDIVVLILGEGYGAVPSGSSLSATHQEYREARGTKPVLAFVQQGVSPEPAQEAFIAEVQSWEGGLFRGGFSSIEELQELIIRALHDVALAAAVGPVDEDALARRAVSLIGDEDRHHSSALFINLALAGGPKQRILRPSELEADALTEALQQSAMFGDHRIFDRARGSGSEIAESDLVISQDTGALIRLCEDGAQALRVLIDEAAAERRMGFSHMSGMVIVEEDVRQRLGVALGFAAGVIERIDPTQRLTNFALALQIGGASQRAWRTRAQNLANPGSVQLGLGARDRPPITLAVRRAALRLDRTNLIDDIVVPLRRQFPQG